MARQEGVPPAYMPHRPNMASAFLGTPNEAPPLLVDLRHTHVKTLRFHKRHTMLCTAVGTKRDDKRLLLALAGEAWLRNTPW